VLAAVLAALPVSGTVCVALCAPQSGAATAEETHGNGHDHHAGPAAGGLHSLPTGHFPSLSLPPHSCLDEHGAQVGLTAALAASRADNGSLTASHDASVSTPLHSTSTSAQRRAGHGPPRGTASTVRTTLVLRI
jgi:hypothetical protein